MQQSNYDLVFKKIENYQYDWSLQRRKCTSTLLTGTLFLDKVAAAAGINIEALLVGFKDFNQQQFSQFFGNTGQLKLGLALYQSFFDSLPEKRLLDYFPLDYEVSLRIVTDCNNLQRLPWQILAKKNNQAQVDFLINHGWSIALALPDRSQDIVKSPEISRILIIAPELQHNRYAPTKGAAHSELLQKKLKQWNGLYKQSDALTVVQTWEALKQQLQAVDWDILYFYGHADLDQQHNSEGSCLVFAHVENNKKVVHVSLNDLQHELTRFGRTPNLIYLNACHSGRSGIASAAQQLQAPAIVVNRSVAFVDEARAQAIRFFECLLTDYDKKTPHHAMQALYQDKQTNLRWLTPVLYQHYKAWQQPCAQQLRFSELDVNWQYLLDRSEQVSILHSCLNSMFNPTERVNTKTEALIWYGTHQQSVGMFSKRIEAEVQNDRSNPAYIPLPLFWHEDEAVDNDVLFNQMLKGCLQVDNFANLPSLLRQQYKLSANRPVVFHLISAPFDIAKGTLHYIPRIFELLYFWNNLVQTHINKQAGLCRFLFSFPCELPNEANLTKVEAFFKRQQQQVFENVSLKSGMSIHLLPALKAVTAEDVDKFFRDKMDEELPIDNPAERKKRIEAFLALGKSSYNKIVSLLPQLAHQLSRAALPKESENKTLEDEIF